MDEEHEAAQYQLWRKILANAALEASAACIQCIRYAPEGTEVVKSYFEPSQYFQQFADETLPSGETWPDNVIPFTPRARG